MGSGTRHVQTVIMSHFSFALLAQTNPAAETGKTARSRHRYRPENQCTSQWHEPNREQNFPEKKENNREKWHYHRILQGGSPPCAAAFAAAPTPRVRVRREEGNCTNNGRRGKWIWEYFGKYWERKNEHRKILMRRILFFFRVFFVVVLIFVD